MKMDPCVSVWLIGTSVEELERPLGYMEEQAKLNTLIDLAESLGIALRNAPAAAGSSEHPGGALVRLKAREILFLDPTASQADQIDAVAAALRGRAELASRFLPPEIRQLIDAGQGA